MNPSILVVEDEDALATLLQYNLDKEGYRVTIATDGEEALMLTAERAPDLVLLDWMLPGLSGIEFARRLRADKRQEVTRLQQSFVSFETSKASSWDVSIVEGEFAHNTGEAMLERWENQGGKNQRRFFFFFGGKLYKMFVSLDVSILADSRTEPAETLSIQLAAPVAAKIGVAAAIGTIL